MTPRAFAMEELPSDNGDVVEDMSVTTKEDPHFDQEQDDPNLVDGVLTQELNRLSVETRTDIQEEIHGVRCMAPKETPEFLAESLRALQHEIDTEIPNHKKQAYRQSQLLPETYVNTDDFRLRFLRCGLFDPTKAAARIVRFLDLALELFGEAALRRPIGLSDFSKQELKFIRKGHYQFLPYRDRGGIVGRRVLCVFPDSEWETLSPILRSRMMMYFTWKAGDDVEAQKEGIVIVVWFDATKAATARPQNMQMKDHALVSVRPTAIHVCSPDTPVFRFRRSLLMMRIGRINRTRLVVHLGNNVEILYKLQSYGIPPDQIPITLGGTIKNTYLKQWMNLRGYLEKNQLACINVGASIPPPPVSSIMPSGIGSNGTTNATNTRIISRIESPFLSDVIFRKGNALVSHPGNTNLRAVILARAKQELLETHHQQLELPMELRQPKMRPTTTIRRFVIDVLREIWKTSLDHQREGTGRPVRFLVWNDEGWWMEKKIDDDDVYTRIEYIAKGIRNTVNKNLRASLEFSLVGGDDGDAAAAANTTTTTNNNNNNNTAAVPSPKAPQHYSSIHGDAITSSRTIHNSSTIPASHHNSNHTITTPTAAASAPTFGAKPTAETPTKAAFRFPTAPTRHQDLHGGTDIFRHQDHSDPAESFLRSVKKRRTLLMAQGTSTGMDTSNGCDDLCGNNTECFGMMFNSTP